MSTPSMSSLYGLSGLAGETALPGLSSGLAGVAGLSSVAGSSVAAPYLIGVVTAPLVVGVLRPLVRGLVKATVTIGLQTKRLAAEAREEFQDITAEASAEMAGRAATAGEVADRT